MIQIHPLHQQQQCFSFFLFSSSAPSAPFVPPAPPAPSTPAVTPASFAPTARAVHSNLSRKFALLQDGGCHHSSNHRSANRMRFDN